MLYYDKIDTQFFTLYIIFSGKTVYRLTLEQPSIEQRRLCDDIAQEITDYLDGKKTKLDIDYSIRGTSIFVQKVLSAIKDIPFGETRTYKWTAGQIGRPNAARAVGTALSKNPLPLIIPCHRVITSSGNLGGYIFGGKIKELLLQLEKTVNITHNLIH